MDPRPTDPTPPMTWAESSAFIADTTAHDAARATAARSFDVVITAWRRRPACRTLADLQRVSGGDPLLAAAIATNRRDWRRIAALETQLIERGWLAEQERSVRITDDGAIIITRQER